MADPEGAQAAMSAAVAAWQIRYLDQASMLGGILADEATVPLDPFTRDGHNPCWCQCGTAHPQDAGVCDMDAIVTRPAASAALGSVDLRICAPCWAAPGIAGMAAS